MTEQAGDSGQARDSGQTSDSGQEPTGETVDVRDNPGEQRFEAWFGGELAGISYYQLQAGQLTFTHTEVQPGFEGHGIGGALANGALTAARASGAPVVPLCPFIADYIRKHPDFLDLVPGPVQKRLEL